MTWSWRLYTAILAEGVIAFLGGIWFDRLMR